MEADGNLKRLVRAGKKMTVEDTKQATVDEL